MASLSISTPIKPCFHPSSTSLKPRSVFTQNLIKNRTLSARASTSSSSPKFFSPFQTALETPPHEDSMDSMSMLLSERIVFLGEEITDFSADSLLNQLFILDAHDSTKEIQIYINSKGGSLSASLAILNVIQLIKAPVSTIAVGQAASTAALILGSGSPGRRFAMPNARIMLCQPSGYAEGPVSSVQNSAVELLANKKEVMEIVSWFTGRPLSQLKKDLEREYFMGPAEAVEYGVIDAIIDEDKVIPTQHITEKFKPTITEYKDPRKYLIPEIPDEEI